MGWKQSWNQLLRTASVSLLRFVPQQSWHLALHKKLLREQLEPSEVGTELGMAELSWAEQNPGLGQHHPSAPCSSLVGLWLFPSWRRAWWLKQLLGVLGATVAAAFNASSAPNPAFSPRLGALSSSVTAQVSHKTGAVTTFSAFPTWQWCWALVYVLFCTGAKQPEFLHGF